MGQEQRHNGCAGRRVISTTRRVQWRVMAVGGHQVQKVDVVGGAAEVDVAQDGA